MSDNKTPIPNSPVFYAGTAATPEGPPIEIAWATPGLKTFTLTCDSRLIRPAAAWISELTRDATALQPYGLALSDLQDFGTSPHELAACMNEVLGDRELFSAAAADDARIGKIFDAAHSTPTFALRRTDATALITELAQKQHLSPTAIARAKRKAEAMCLIGTRAEAKVSFLVMYWNFVAAGN
jgi:hypothetical protein